MTALPFFSIVTPTYQCGRFVERVAWAVAQQTCDDWEWVVVDDGSTDETPDILERTAQRMNGRLKQVRFPRNRGRAAARNAGMEAARGRHIVWWDMDDLAMPERLARLAAALESGADFATSHAVLIDDQGRAIGRRGFRDDPLLGRIFLGPTAAVRADLARRIGFDEGMRVGEDKRMVYTLARTARGTYLDEPLYLYFESRDASPAKAEADCRNEIALLQSWAAGSTGAEQRRWTARLRRLRSKRAVLALLRLAPAVYAMSVRRRERSDLDTGATVRTFLQRVHSQPLRGATVEPAVR